MASLQAEKLVESQSLRQVKKEPAKPSGSTPKAPSSKSAPKKTQKRSQPKQKLGGVAVPIAITMAEPSARCAL
ncbi:hypothetical protein JHK85_024890 [Glycine max]|nr:hypothetical protein JHK85_024890 [Glycine max]KAG5012142.1 hypothetical protein JHK86_024403 [Glycine max]